MNLGVDTWFYVRVSHPVLSGQCHLTITQEAKIIYSDVNLTVTQLLQ